MARKAASKRKGKAGSSGSRIRSKQKAGNNSGRLDRETWIRAAWDELQRGGVDGLTVDSLAKKLEVTRGSFYWHFQSRDHLLESLLDWWEDWSAQRYLDLLETLEGTPWSRIEAMLEDATRSRILVMDQVFRAWARGNERVGAAVRRVDRLRLTLVGNLFRGLGYSKPQAELRARIFYGWALSQAHFLDGYKMEPEARFRQGMSVLAVLTQDRNKGKRPGGKG